VERAAPEATKPPAPVWHRFAEFQTWAPVTTRFRTEHLTEVRMATTHASPEAAEPYVRLVAGLELPPGSALVEALASDAVSPASAFLVMERSESDWRYLALDAEGRSLSIDETACGRCHADALTDQLFGVGAAALEAKPSIPME
jgi:hypothetical protein